MVWLTLTFSIRASGAELRVLLLLTNSSASYQTFSNSFTKNLPATIHLSVLDSPEGLIGRTAGVDLIVAVGMKATEMAIFQSTNPVLAVMLPQASYDALTARIASSPRALNVAAIYLNQPWERQLDFLFAVLPERRKVGLLYSPDMQKELPHLREEIISHGGSVMAQPVYSDATLFADLEKVLQSSEVLLAVPDSAIYSSSNVRNILLSTYRQNVPLIGWSQAYVNAGAVAALFSTPEQLAEQSVATVLGYAQTARWPLSQYPHHYTIALNQQVARSLGIVLESDEAIRLRMKKNRRSAND